MIVRFAGDSEAIGDGCFASSFGVKACRVVVVQNCGIDLRLPAALRRGSVCQNCSIQHVSRTYVGESVGGHLDGVGCVAGLALLDS